MNASYRRSRELAEQRRERMSNGPEKRSTDFLSKAMSQRHSRIMGETAAGVPVDESTAMSVSAVFCAVRTLSESKGMLPVSVWERRPHGEADVQVNSHPVAEMFQFAPNPDQTPLVFQEQRQHHAALWGDNFTLLSFDRGTGEVIEGGVIHPSRVTPFFDPNRRDGRGRPRLFYEIRETVSETRIVDASQMLHCPWMPTDGINGTSVVRCGAGSMGISLASDRLVASFYANAGTPSMIVTAPDFMDDGPFERLKREINTEYNAGNAFRSMLLEGGLTATFATMPFGDYQLLESREFQGREIAQRWFKLPGHLAGYTDAPGDLSEEDRRFVVHTLSPWIIRDEQEWNRKAFTRAERGKYYIKHNVEAFLRGDTKTRYEAHRSAVFTGWMSVNEVRAIEDLPPMEGGDVLPRPAAIWGNDQPDGADEPGGASDGDSRSLEPVRQLAIDTVEAMLGAERVHAERTAGRDDVEQRTATFYGSHQRKLATRLAAICGAGDTAIAAHCERHAAELRLANTDADPASAVALCVEGWRDDAARLIDELLNGHDSINLDSEKDE